MIPIVSVIGRTNSGKTTVIEQLLPALSRRGYRVATVKHHHHGDFDADQPGKDSWRHAQAGAVATALAGSRRLAIFQNVESDVPLETIVGLFLPAPDIVVTEGYGDAAYPKIEVVRIEPGVPPLSDRNEGLIALVTDGDWDLGVPRFALDRIDELAEFVIRAVLHSAASTDTPGMSPDRARTDR